MKLAALLTLLLAPLGAQAVVGTSARAGNGGAWEGVGQMSGATAVAVGPHLVLTAGHVGAGDFLLGGTVYDAVATELAPKVGKNAVDLRLVSVADTLPTWYDLGSSAKNGQTVTMVGYGGAGYVNTAGNGYVVTGGSGQTVGTNVLSDKGTTNGLGPTLRAKLKKAGDGVLTIGDSGGGWFANGKLIGISDFVYSTNARKPAYGFDKKGYFGSGAIDLTDKALRKWLNARIAADALSAGGAGSRSLNGSVQAVPEPAAFAPLALVAALFARRRRG